MDGWGGRGTAASDRYCSQRGGAARSSFGSTFPKTNWNVYLHLSVFTLGRRVSRCAVPQRVRYTVFANWTGATWPSQFGQTF